MSEETNVGTMSNNNLYKLNSCLHSYFVMSTKILKPNVTGIKNKTAFKNKGIKNVISKPAPHNFNT